MFARNVGQSQVIDDLLVKLQTKLQAEIAFQERFHEIMVLFLSATHLGTRFAAFCQLTVLWL